VFHVTFFGDKVEFEGSPNVDSPLVILPYIDTPKSNPLKNCSGFVLQYFIFLGKRGAVEK